MESPTRNLLALGSLALLAYVTLALATCAVVSVAIDGVATGGLATLGAAGGDLRPALFIGVVMAAAGMQGIWSLNRQLTATERLARDIRPHRHRPPPMVERVAEEVGLRGRVDVVESPEVFSFTYGFALPRVVVSTGIIARTDERELRAVLAHERYHVQHRDPLKSLAARALPHAFFFLPVMRELRDRYLLGRELAADRRVIGKYGPAPLAGALYRFLVEAPAGFQPAAGAAVGGFELLPARLEQIETGDEPAEPPLSSRALISSGVAVVVLTAAVATASGALPGGIAHVHGSMSASAASPVAGVGGILCAALLAWVVWRVVRWLTAVRPIRRST